MTIFEVGQIWEHREYTGPGNRYCIAYFVTRHALSTLVLAYAYLVDRDGNGNSNETIYFAATTASHIAHQSLEENWMIIGTKKPIVDKVIPDFPLDPSLHTLQAGYIQDRQRKKYKP
jgi:hypothetical protein